MRKKSRPVKCLDCGEIIKDFEHYTSDRKRRGLICEACGPGRPQMMKPEKKKR
jgi:DNA-directed RNA polymerase subunit RPC12/RpoP